MAPEPRVDFGAIGIPEFDQASKVSNCQRFTVRRKGSCKNGCTRTDQASYFGSRRCIPNLGPGIMRSRQEKTPISGELNGSDRSIMRQSANLSSAIRLPNNGCAILRTTHDQQALTRNCYAFYWHLMPRQ